VCARISNACFEYSKPCSKLDLKCNTRNVRATVKALGATLLGIYTMIRVTCNAYNASVQLINDPKASLT
jgi:hypothetical protein